MKYFEHRFLQRLAKGQLSEEEHIQFKHWLFTLNSHTQELWLQAFAKSHATQNYFSINSPFQSHQKKSLKSWIAAAAVLLLLSLLAAFLFLNNSQQHKKQYFSGALQNEIILADNTKVDLNSNSRINVVYTKNERQIELKGEALFYVNKDKKRPMVVKTELVKATVTGTIFKIKQSIRGIQVALREGGISVTNNEKTLNLKPNQQWIWNRSNGKEILLNYDQDTPWEYVRFDDEPLSKVLYFIEWKYNVSFENDNEYLSECFISITIEDVALEKVLELVSFISNVKFEPIDNQQFRLSEKCK
jgi:ferric-dicitrate binding protein FerR (iron transport regulator)